MDSISAKIAEYCRVGEHQKLAELIHNTQDKSALLLHADEERMLPLHHALLNADKSCVQVLLNAGASSSAPFLGLYPIHLSVALASYPEFQRHCVDCLKLLTDSGVDRQDRLGRTALHIAASAGHLEAVELLLSRSASLSMQDYSGKTPFEAAIDTDQGHVLRALLSRPNASSPASLADYALKKRSKECLQVLLAPSDIPTFNDQACLIIAHEACLKHIAFNPAFDVAPYIHQIRKFVPQNPQRLRVLSSGLFSSPLFRRKTRLISDPPRAQIADVLLVHSLPYYRTLVQATQRLGPTELPHKLDFETLVTSESLDAALFAAGSVTHAVDLIMRGEASTAFCMVRPPGHHTGTNGAVLDPEVPQPSLGFCLLNNVAIGAAYAMNRYRNEIKKVAIIDFDVHHGNGTQNIVENLQPSSGAFKPWLSDSDFNNVLFVSSHGFGPVKEGKFYPGGGRESSGTYPHGILNLPCPFGTDSLDMREIYRSRVFPRVRDFGPDIIFISAGFDGHALDTLNNRYMKLDEDDYFWMTEELVRLAGRNRVVSALEGGYNTRGGVLSPLALSVSAHVQALMSGPTEPHEQNSADLVRKRQHVEEAIPATKVKIELGPELIGLWMADHNLSDDELQPNK